MNVLLLVNIGIYLIYTYIISTKSLHMLQQNRYNRGYRYIKWILKNFEETLINTNLLFLVFAILYWIPGSNNYVSYVFMGVNLFNIIVFFLKKKKAQVKIPLKYTTRIKRLIVTNMVLHAIPALIFVLTYNEKLLSIYYLLFGYINYMNFFLLILMNFINRPAEKMVGKYYENKAKKKLKTMTNMKVIGITGSYGKTSSKNILNDILNIKYNSYKTPANYNTPNGLMLTINNYMDQYNDFFVAEMGACKHGEIKELCDLVHPTYGIITKIGIAHLETFGSEEIIQNTKFELIESLPSDGLGVLNADDEKQVSYKIKNDCKIKWISIDNKDADVRAENINLTYKGTTFDVIFKGDKTKYQFETKLLGKANIYNILAGICLGEHLGISIKDLQTAVKKVEPVEHRLCMKMYYDINLIDDAYNANPNGCEMAIDVLSKMPGKKIIVTSGMIELGEKSYEANKELGKQIAKYGIDEAILVGENQTKPIQDGLKEAKYSSKNIHIINNVLDAFPLLQELKEGNTYALLQSDLPDTFNEK